MTQMAKEMLAASEERMRNADNSNIIHRLNNYDRELKELTE